MDQRTRGDRSPLEVMLDDMLFWDRAVDEFDKAAKMCAWERIDHPTPKRLKELQKLRKASAAARTKCWKAAVRCMPYCHPKLRPIDLEPERNIDRRKFDEGAESVL